VGEVKESEIGNKGQRLSVAEVIAHENYRGSSNSFSNDIALLRLSSKAIFNDFVRPAMCIDFAPVSTTVDSF
jgi:secreted trypsin-like serine protease